MVLPTGAPVQSIRKNRQGRGRNSLRFSLGDSMLTTISKTEIRGEPMNVRILVVDDNAKVRDGLRLLLQSHADWEVCGEAADGIEAIEKYRQLTPDLLIVDVSMPRMNGLDASLEILKFSPRILILLYTSYLTAQLIDVAHKAGIRGTFQRQHASHRARLGGFTSWRGIQRSSKLKPGRPSGVAPLDAVPPQTGRMGVSSLSCAIWLSRRRVFLPVSKYGPRGSRWYCIQARRFLAPAELTMLSRRPPNGEERF